MKAIEDQARSVFLAILERGPDEWSTFLDQACGTDTALRARVDQLLDAHRAMGSIHRGAAAPSVAIIEDPILEGPGATIGPFKLLEQIGEGGFGVVFMAEQQQPIRRKVALKIVKPGMDTGQVIARFKAERQALALMDHPNIAKVLDAGATPTGRPYFAMELVKGIPITDYCDRSQLTPRERLGLFLHVCQAVQHAHQKGIIHRDLKPSNILVTEQDGAALVKVIDFGVAKALGQQLTDKTFFTGFAQMIGTPLYMSPEQTALSNVDVDTRSDIYSLGVLLYELLTGTTPFDKERLKTVGYEELCRIIREEEPPKPSTRLSTLGDAAATVSTQRQSDPRRLRRLIRGELDWIVMKALEKDRNRRYETTNSFAADVQRYLHDEPVQACPPSAGYRVRKFVRRNRGPVLAAGLILLALAAGLAVSTWQAVVADQERVVADQERQRADQSLEESQRSLWQAKLAQAQAGRWSGRAGRAFDSLQALAEAAQITRDLNVSEKDLLKLRNEAIACAALPDLRRRPEYDRFSMTGLVDSRWEQWATSDARGEITIRSIPDQREIARLKGFGRLPSRMCFSPDRRFLVAMYRRDQQPGPGHLLVWDVTRGEIALQEDVMGIDEDCDPKVTWSNDSRRLAIYYGWHQGFTARVAVYDVRARRVIQVASGTNPLCSFAFDPKGTRLAILGNNGAVQMHEAETGKRVGRFTLPVPAKGMAWGCDGRFLAATYVEVSDWKDSARIYVWDVPAGRMHKILDGHRNTPIHLAFNHAGNLLASNSWDGTLRLWNPWTGKELLRTNGDWGLLQFSPDDRFLSVGNGWDVVTRRCWEVRTSRAYQELYCPPQETIGVYAKGFVAFSPDGRLVASETDGVRLWDVAGAKHLATLSSDGLFRFDADGALVTHISGVGARWPLSYQSNEAGVRLRLGPAKLLPPPRPRQAEDERLRSPDGRWTASAKKGEGVSVWDTRSGKVERRLESMETPVCFSPDGQWLVTGSDKEYAFVRVGSWQIGHTIPRPNQFLFSPDSKLAAFNYPGDWTARLINASNGRELGALAGPEGMLGNCFAFSSDGSQFVMVTGHDMLQLWNLRALRRQLTELDLDWDQPPYPPPPTWQTEPAQPLQLDLDQGQLMEREKYSLILAFFPLHAEAYYRRGLAHARFGQLPEALADFNTALALQPHQAEAHYQRGLIHGRQARFREAADDFSRTIDLRPDDLDAYVQRGHACVCLSQWDKAAADFSKALQRGSDDWTLWYFRGLAYEWLGDWRRADADFSKVLELDPQCALGWHQRGNVRIGLGEGQDAVNDLTRALEIKRQTVVPISRFPWAADSRESLVLEIDRIAVLSGRGGAYCNLQQWDKAEADFTKASELDPNNPFPCYLRALARLGAGDLIGYRRTCAEMLQRFGQPQKPEAANWVAWTLCLAPDAVRDREQPVKLAEQALRGEPKSDQYMVTLTAALYRAGRFDEAIAQLDAVDRPRQQGATQRALICPAYIWFFLAMAHHRLGQAEEARRWLDRAVTWIEEEMHDPKSAVGQLWNRRLTLQQLRREAEKLILASTEKPGSNGPQRRSTGAPKKPDEK